MEAARALYEAYLSGTQGQSADNHSGGHSGGAGTKTKTNAEGTQEKSFRDTLLANLPGDQPKTDYRTAASIVARMSPQERKRLYNLSDPAYRQLRGELVYSLGRDGFNRLIQDYPV